MLYAQAISGRVTDRTKPYGYALFNIDAFANVAQILSTPEDNLWEFETPDGRSLKLGMEFIGDPQPACPASRDLDESVAIKGWLFYQHMQINDFIILVISVGNMRYSIFEAYMIINNKNTTYANKERDLS